MLALAACNKTETPAADGADATAAATPAVTAPMPPAITSQVVYRCKDNTVLYVDFFGANEAADIRVADKASAPIRVMAPVVPAPAAGAAPVDPAAPAAKPAGPMKSADGAISLSGAGKQVNVKLADKGAQTCKGA